MNLDETLLEVLRCPETKQALRLATSDELGKINAARDDESREALEGALIREDGKRAYPVEDGFPILLLESAIELEL